jgi:hypothetical protein
MMVPLLMRMAFTSVTTHRLYRLDHTFTSVTTHRLYRLDHTFTSDGSCPINIRAAMTVW